MNEKLLNKKLKDITVTEFLDIQKECPITKDFEYERRVLLMLGVDRFSETFREIKRNPISMSLFKLCSNLERERDMMVKLLY